MKKRVILFAVILLLFIPLAAAKQGHMKLLAVTETLDGDNGSIADLTLEIRKGHGKVFVDTFPLTKFDTQISMRFAKQIACNFLDIDCSSFDFSYTIEAKTGIIGGPSAGAAAATLTVLMLNDLDFDETISITGTINSGGVIGPVGGLKEKINAASKDSLTKVLIAPGQRLFTEDEEENITIDLIEFGKEKGVEILEVTSLNDAVYILSGSKIIADDEELLIDESYKHVMQFLAEKLCSRTRSLKEYFHKEVAGRISDADVLSKAESAMNLSETAEEAYDEGKYYSAASYCFRSNVDFSHLVLYSQYPSEKEVRKKIDELEVKLNKFEEKIESHELKTITDLQTYMIVKERILEARDYINDTLEILEDDVQDSLFFLAFAYERLNSAESWASFFDTEGKEFELDPERIKASCKNKIAEAEERYQYVKVHILRPISTVDQELKRAYEHLEEGNYELCLFKASKAKAEADSIVSIFGVNEEDINELFEQKITVTERTLARAQQKGIFPIIGYSYYEYAKSIKEDNIGAALLFLEYSLEIGNLDVYFEPKKPLYLKLDLEWLGYLLLGIAIGIAVMIPVKLREPEKEKRRKVRRITKKSAKKRSKKRKKPRKKRKKT